MFPSGCIVCQGEEWSPGNNCPDWFYEPLAGGALWDLSLYSLPVKFLKSFFWYPAVWSKSSSEWWRDSKGDSLWIRICRCRIPKGETILNYISFKQLNAFKTKLTCFTCLLTCPNRYWCSRHHSKIHLNDYRSLKTTLPSRQSEHPSKRPNATLTYRWLRKFMVDFWVRVLPSFLLWRQGEEGRYQAALRTRRDHFAFSGALPSTLLLLRSCCDGHFSHELDGFDSIWKTLGNSDCANTHSSRYFAKVSSNLLIHARHFQSFRWRDPERATKARRELPWRGS